MKMAMISRHAPPVRIPVPHRSFSNRAHMPSGLRFIPQFLDKKAYAKLVEESFQLEANIARLAEGIASEKGRTYLSRQHNLKSDEFYKKVRLNEIDCQHFDRYGDNGHTLTYFIGNKNIPKYLEGLKNKIESLEEVHALEGVLNWNFTFNTYRSLNVVRPGFPFHIDTPSNGEITSIFTLLSDADLQMKKETDQDPVYSVKLVPGSLRLLTGEARWKWQHRVLPSERTAQDGRIERMSLVLGCNISQHFPTAEEIQRNPRLRKKLAQWHKDSANDPDSQQITKENMQHFIDSIKRDMLGK